MADLLLSLSAWMLISLTVLPIGIDFLKESMNEKVDYEARVILYEKLQEGLAEGQILPPHFISRNGKQYNFIPRTETKEVCIEYENDNKEKEIVCEFLE